MPAILALGIITSYEDIKEGKIRNKWIVAALIYAIIAYVGLITHYYLQGTLRVEYLIELSANVLFVIAIGFGMWLSKIWTAGDGKLFIAYSALIPLSIYRVGYIKWFPSLILLINIFAPIFIFLVVALLFKSSKEQKWSVFKEVANPKKLANSFVSLFAIFWVIQFIFALTNMPKNYVLYISVSILVFTLLQKALKKNFLGISIIIAALRFAIDKSVYSIEFFKHILFLFLFWIVFRTFILELGVNFFSKRIKIKDLKSGMILTEKAHKYLTKNNKSLLERKSEGLTKDDINKIKKYYLTKKIKQASLEIQQTLPFAPFIFLGVLLTILARGNALMVLAFLLQ